MTRYYKAFLRWVYGFMSKSARREAQVFLERQILFLFSTGCSVAEIQRILMDRGQSKTLAEIEKIRTISSRRQLVDIDELTKI